MVKKVVIGALCFVIVGLAVAFGPGMLGGFEATRIDTDTDTQLVATVTPGASATTNHTTVTFTYPLLSADSGFITSITSNATETLSVAAGTLTTTSMNVTGHTDAVNPRSLIIVYDYGTNQFYTGFGAVVTMGPVLVLLGFIILVGIIGFMGMKLGLGKGR